MGLKDWLISRETIVHKMVVDTKEGTAVGLVETIYYGPKKTGGHPMHRSSMTCICLDIYRRHLTWSDADGIDDLMPNNNSAKSLCRRLRTELNKLVAEGKLHGESIIRNADRQPTA